MLAHLCECPCGAANVCGTKDHRVAPGSRIIERHTTHYLQTQCSVVGPISININAFHTLEPSHVAHKPARYRGRDEDSK